MAPKNKDKKLHAKDIWANIGCLAIVIIFAVWGVVFYNGVNHNLHRGTATMHADASYKDGILTLTNEDKYDWKFAWIALDTDDDPNTYEYNYYLHVIEARTRNFIDLAEFTKNNIDHFDPVTMKPKHLSVFADTDNGIGHFVYTFK